MSAVLLDFRRHGAVESGDREVEREYRSIVSLSGTMEMTDTWYNPSQRGDSCTVIDKDLSGTLESASSSDENGGKSLIEPECQLSGAFASDPRVKSASMSQTVIFGESEVVSRMK